MRALIRFHWAILLVAFTGGIPLVGQTTHAVPAASIDQCDAAFNAVWARTSLDSEIEAYRRCSDIRPKAGFAHQNLGLLYEAQGKWELAEKEFGIALRLGLSAGLAQKTKQELRATELKLHQNATERAEADHVERADRAKRYLNANQLVDAEALARSLTLDPMATFKDFVLLGVIEFAMNDYSSATRDLLHANQIAPPPQQPEIETLVKKSVDESEYLRLTTMAQLAARNLNAAQAGDLFAAAWHLHPERTDAGLAAVTCYLATPRSNRSLSILDALVRSTDTSAAARAVAIRSGLVDIDRTVYGRHREAREMIANLMAKYKSPEDLSDLSGKKLAVLEDDVRQALVLDPHSVLAHRLLAFCLMREKKYSQAVEQYRAILKDDPQQKVWFWLAWALWKAGHGDDARVALSQDQLNPAKVDASLKASLLEELASVGK